MSACCGAWVVYQVYRALILPVVDWICWHLPDQGSFAVVGVAVGWAP